MVDMVVALAYWPLQEHSLHLATSDLQVVDFEQIQESGVQVGIPTMEVGFPERQLVPEHIGS